MFLLFSELVKEVDCYQTSRRDAVCSWIPNTHIRELQFFFVYVWSLCTSHQFSHWLFTNDSLWLHNQTCLNQKNSCYLRLKFLSHWITGRLAQIWSNYGPVSLINKVYITCSDYIRKYDPWSRPSLRQLQAFFPQSFHLHRNAALLSNSLTTDLGQYVFYAEKLSVRKACPICCHSATKRAGTHGSKQ